MNSPGSPGTGVRVGTPVAINTSPAVVRKTSYDVTLGGGLVMNTVLAPLSTPAGSGLIPCCGRAWSSLQGLPAPGEEIVPSKETVVKKVSKCQQPLDGETPSGAGEPTCAPRDGRGFHT